MPTEALAADPVFPNIRADVNEVQLGMVATDQAGRPVSTLSVADLKVLEDGAPVNHFGLNSAHDLPLFTTVIYDTSESNQKCWQQMQKPVMRFVESTIGKQDQLWIAAFDSKLQFKSQIRQADQLSNALSVRGGHDNVTAFNDSLLGMLRDHSSSDAQPRRAAMIVFSDGEDNYSVHSVGDVISAAQQGKVAVYTIRRRRNRGWENGGGILHAIAAGTGGRDFTVSNTRELEKALATIGNELRSGYVLYYSARPSRSGNDFRSVSVRPNRNKRIRIQVQNAYYVPADRRDDAQ